MGTSLQLVPLLEPIRPEMEQVESLFIEALAGVEEPLSSMLRPSLGGGKRLRPALVVLIGRMFDQPAAPFRSLAAAMDMLHAATLIHDDVVDGASMRRGQETLHTRWPAGATVLAGDYLLGQSTSLIADLGHPRILKLFGIVLRTMCAGEIRQMAVTRGRHRDQEDYYRSIEAKTASLFATSTEMAGILAGAEELQVVALRRFGRELGMAFQIVDDVLDLTGDAVQLGKPIGSDLRHGLITLPILRHLERMEDDVHVNAVLSGRRDEEHVRAAIAAVRASGAIEISLAEARAHARRSQEALAPLPDNTPRQLLHSLVEYIVERNR
jgi:geranylgeranyl pyrophosphate synthase